MSTFYIASLAHTDRQDEHIRFWGRRHRGYTPVVGDYIGTYCFGEAVDLNDGEVCLAVPVDAVRALLSPEPYFAAGGKACRFFDQRGPVVDNTRANWAALVAASFPDGRSVTPQPEVFRGRRRAFSIEVPHG